MWLMVVLLACGPPRGDAFGLSRSGAPSDELVYNNTTEPEYIDPGLATGHPDSRIIGELFDGLTEYDPDDLSPRPSHAASWDEHPDGRGYTFHLREGAVWSDGSPVTAHDYTWSWERVLNPIYLARYAQQLYAVKNAALYNQGRIFVLAEAVAGVPAGTPVVLERTPVQRLLTDIEPRDAPGGAPVGATLGSESLVEASDERDGWVQVSWTQDCPDLGDQAALIDCAIDPRAGWLPAEALESAWPLLAERILAEPAELVTAEGESLLALQRGDRVVVVGSDGERRRVYFGEGERWGWLDADVLAFPRAGLTFTARVAEPVRFLGPRPRADTATGPPPGDEAVPPDRADDDAPAGRRIEVRADQVTTSPEVLGFTAHDDHTLEVRFDGVAPYFLLQTSHQTLRAAPRQAIEAHGSRWTRPEHIVTSGPFLLDEHVVRDKFVLVANPDWWGADTLKLRKVTAYSIESLVTSVNLYRAGYTDLVVANDIPPEFIPMIQDKDDFEVGPALSVYVYRFNTTRPPFDDARVRRALAMAVDRGSVVEVMKAGQIPANHIVPPGIPGYEPAEGPDFDPAAARALLAEAGFPDGEGFPEVNILYNTKESHKHVAAVIQDNWRTHLGIDVRLENREWKTYLKTVNSLDYDIARGGWIGDYVDPNTFLDLWVSDGGNNNTGWGDPRYDRLIGEAATEPDPEARMATFAAAEAILNEQMPFIPIYWYVWPELKQPGMRGHHSNLLDQHPLRWVWIDR